MGNANRPLITARMDANRALYINKKEQQQCGSFLFGLLFLLKIARLLISNFADAVSPLTTPRSPLLMPFL